MLQAGEQRSLAKARTIALRFDFSATEPRRLARPSSDAAQARRLLALAAIYNGGTVRRRDGAAFELINHQSVTLARKRAGLEGSPAAAAVTDSQSVKTAESGGPCGYGVGKKIKGRK